MTKLRPSKAGLWVNCAGSLLVEDTFTTSSAAMEGTAIHKVAENILKRLPLDFGVEVPEIDGEMLDVAEGYVNYIKALSRGESAQIEYMVDISSVTGEVNATGTVDAFAIVDGVLHVIDLKTGRTPVNAKGNYQLLVYALALYNEFSTFYQIDSVELHIYQPRINNTNYESCTLEQLNKYMELFKTRAALGLQAVETGCASYKAGEHCRQYYCPAIGTCQAAADYVESAVGGFQNLPITHDDLDNVDLANKFKTLDMVHHWCDMVYEHVFNVLKAGGSVEGLKLVQGRNPPRKWVDEDQAEETLKSMRIKQDVMYIKKLISPTQAEDAHKKGGISAKKWETLQEQITRGQPALVIASVDDKREPVNVNTVDDFDNLEEI